MRHLVGTADEFPVGLRRIVAIGDLSVGVFAHEGQFYAFENVCPHQGGPVCEGILIQRVEERTDEFGGALGAFGDECHIVCPWHGMEFDIATGRAWSDPSKRLRSLVVTEDRGEIFVDA